MSHLHETAEALVHPNGRLTKAAIAEAGQAMAADVLAGDVDPLETYIRLRALREAIDEALSTIEDPAIDEAGRYSKDDSDLASLASVMMSQRRQLALAVLPWSHAPRTNAEVLAYSILINEPAPASDGDDLARFDAWLQGQGCASLQEKENDND